MRHLHPALVAVTLLGGSAVAWLLPGVESAGADASSVAAPGVLRHQTMTFYEQRLKEDPHSALDMAQLAALFMEEGRLAEEDGAFVKAESLARRSLGERTRRNGRSAALLVNALLAQHRFPEAAEMAHELVGWDPETPAYRALLAETSMEVGYYDQAIRMLGSIRANRADLGIAPRFARWAELTGRTGDARRILRAARDDAFKRPDLAPEQRAWFSVRLADLELRFGHLRGAAAAIEAGLRDSPDDWRLTLARARLQAARGEWREAVRSAEQVVAIVPSADAFALLATAHRELGHEQEADGFAAALQAIALRPSGIHRTWAMVLLDLGNAGEIVTRAARDTLVRRDVHTLDLLAWALYRDGRPSEALPLARRAIALGSLEPLLRYHAGVIESAAGDPWLAEQHLTIALRGRGALSRPQAVDAKRLVITNRERARN